MLVLEGEGLMKLNFAQVHWLLADHGQLMNGCLWKLMKLETDDQKENSLLRWTKMMGIKYHFYCRHDW